MAELYAVGALFATPEAILRATVAVRKNGYLEFDVNTPYPVHGVDGAMGLKDSNIGWFAFVFGLLGMTAAVLLQWWTSAMDYPLAVGGKPLFSAPAFVPISFEMTILLAAFGVVGILFAFYLKLPFNAHPLHDSPYMQQVSSHRFGIYIQVADERFEFNKVAELLLSLGADKIEPIYLEERPHRAKPAVFDKKFMAAMLILFVGVSLATALHLGVVLESPPFNWMTVQPKYAAQSSSNLFADGTAMRKPVSGTIARGYIPYAYPDSPDEAALNLINLLLPTDEVLARGQDRYTVFCSMCHGDYGHGKGLMKDKYPAPPSLHSRKLRSEWTDGRIYHVLAVGRNAMPAFQAQLSRSDRWAIVHYLRVLQRSAFAKDSDLE